MTVLEKYKNNTRETQVSNSVNFLYLSKITVISPPAALFTAAQYALKLTLHQLKFCLPLNNI